MELNSEVLDKNCFFEDDFNVDNYLSTHIQKFDLVTLRKELKNYGAQLHNETINILKTETKSIVQFAESLCLLQSKVLKLSQPVYQFKEEITTIHEFITQIQENFNKISTGLQNSNHQQCLINLKIGVICTITYIKSIILSSNLLKRDLVTLEWLVNEYSFYLNYLKELGFKHSELDENTIEIENKLKEYIKNSFLEAIKDRNEKFILCCLRLYSSLSEQAEAEKIIREKVIMPKLKVIFSQDNLDKNSQDLNVLYAEALEVLKNEVNFLHKLIDENPEITGFNFVVNSFWKELDIELIERFSNITAPGNPSLFQKRFCDSWNFLQEIIKCYPSLSDKNVFYQSHIKRFNLPVYFEIRYQQIGAKLEESIVESNDIVSNIPNTSSNELEINKLFYLKQSSVLWECICLCFSKDVFLEHLTDQFLRLSMLLLSRYLKWLTNVINDNEKTKPDIFYVQSLADLSVLQSKIGFDFRDNIQSSIYSILPTKVKAIIVKIFKTNGEKIEATQNIIKNKLVMKKVHSTDTQLQQVRSIPRMYRKTNRSTPKAPSSYVVELINDFDSFYESHCFNDASKNILVSVIERTSQKYLDLVKDVLHSVSETEKSLRRLKNRSLTNTDEFFNQGTLPEQIVSDEVKIKEQIKLDMNYYLKGIQKFSLQYDTALVKQLSQIDLFS